MVVLLTADARRLPLADASVDLVVTSPPYWRKRDYGIHGQLGQENDPAGYVAALMTCLTEWQRVLTPTGSVFLNVGDTWHRRSLTGIPGRVEAAATDAGWLLRNRIVWAKTRGMPDPARDRLANRYEYVLHLTRRNYYYDLHGYAEEYGKGANPGDVWHIEPERGMSPHLAPFPRELARRAILLGCPRAVCTVCGTPQRRIIGRSTQLDASRPQARRAMQLAEDLGLTPAHIAAIQATGISDAGKALLVQTGTGRNSAQVQRLAREAKAALGGYFREFTMAPRITAGWSDCGHDALRTGIVLDPFSGTASTGAAGVELGRSYIGVDLDPDCHRLAVSRLAQPALPRGGVVVVPARPPGRCPWGRGCSTGAAGPGWWGYLRR